MSMSATGSVMHWNVREAESTMVVSTINVKKIKFSASQGSLGRNARLNLIIQSSGCQSERGMAKVRNTGTYKAEVVQNSEGHLKDIFMVVPKTIHRTGFCM